MSCLMAGCETEKLGGCFCLCRLRDRKHELECLLEGAMLRKKGAVVYVPFRERIPLKGVEREMTLRQLEKIRERIAEYEIDYLGGSESAGETSGSTD